VPAEGAPAGGVPEPAGCEVPGCPGGCPGCELPDWLPDGWLGVCEPLGDGMLLGVDGELGGGVCWLLEQPTQVSIRPANARVNAREIGFARVCMITP